MFCSSDSEDENLKLILEAADTSLLTNSLYSGQRDDAVPPKTGAKESQRHLKENDQAVIDFVPSVVVQNLMSKKLSLIVEATIEFVTDECDPNCTNPKTKYNQKSKVKLLNDFECYAKAYEDFESEKICQRKKPTVKRRVIDADELDEERKFKSAAVAGSFILSRKEVENWSSKSKGKIFSYKVGGGTAKLQHLIEPENEFTKLRRKNKWNEDKIRSTKFSVKLKNV